MTVNYNLGHYCIPYLKLAELLHSSLLWRLNFLLIWMFLWLQRISDRWAFLHFFISDLGWTATLNGSLKDLYFLGSPLDLLISNFGNFIFIVLLTRLFLSMPLVDSSCFSFSGLCCNILSIFNIKIAISLKSSSAVSILWVIYPSSSISFRIFSSSFKFIWAFLSHCNFLIIALHCYLHCQYLATSDWRLKLTFLNRLYALLFFFLAKVGSTPSVDITFRLKRKLCWKFVDVI